MADYDYEAELYSKMCWSCHREKECHEGCFHCDAYLEKLEEMEKELLKRCPFCGSEEVEMGVNDVGNWCVACLNCGACGRDEMKRGRAAEAWNKRYEDSLSFCMDCRWWEDGYCNLHKIRTKKNDYCAGAWRRHDLLERD